MAVGKKTGGRKAGTPNKATAAKAAEIAASGLTPLEYLIEVMRAPCPPELLQAVEAGGLDVKTVSALASWHAQRIDAAKAAAPYVHPKLASVEVKNPPGEEFAVGFKTDTEFARRIAFFLTKAMREKTP